MGEHPFSSALHDLMARARVTARAHTLPFEHELQSKHREAFMELGESELGESVAEMIAALRAVDGLPPEVSAFLDRAGAPEHQWQVLILIGIVIWMGQVIANQLIPPMLQDAVNDQWHRFQATPLTPADTALAALRGHMDPADAKHEATLTGLSGDRWQTLFDNTGEPPAPQELLLLWRRGQIDTARLERGIRQSRVRNEWIDAIEALRYAPPSPSEVIIGAVQNHLTVDDASRMVGEAGIDPANFGWMYETAGRPPGVIEFGHLVNRGFASEDEWRQAIRESDIKNKYIDAVMQMRFYIPPVRSIVAMLRSGAIAEDRGRQLLAENGVRPPDADGFVREALKSKSAHHRDLTSATFLAAYKDRMTDRATTSAHLVTLGYDAAETAFLLDLADAEHALTLRREVIRAIRAKYVAHHVDAATASAALDTAGVQAIEREELLKIWAIERGAATRELTVAQLTRGVKHGVLTSADMAARLAAMGYPPGDALLLIAIEGLPAPGA